LFFDAKEETRTKFGFLLSFVETVSGHTVSGSAADSQVLHLLASAKMSQGFSTTYRLLPSVTSSNVAPLPPDVISAARVMR